MGTAPPGNLSGMSAAQLEWIRKNHMEPADSNPRLGRKPPRGDFFKNMRQYLDERETGPLP